MLLDELISDQRMSKQCAKHDQKTDLEDLKNVAHPSTSLLSISLIVLYLDLGQKTPS